ncbi:hypothetical protein CDD82_4153 [Ophiocordyceps australis]|uniref:Uncharacterized protein n=1 Tax=Ophiocordyceps australis TaxID=1399860 RepID=A0A2C5Z2L0_9HYPO|nr:hypothetical protein CDD82_4153 [Ophiocordyceps australis]
MQHSCGLMRKVSVLALSLLQWCSNVNQTEFPEDCKSAALASAIAETLPHELVAIIRDKMNTTYSSLIAGITEAVTYDNDNDAYLLYSVKWYTTSSEAELEVCWPDLPDFEFNDFQSGLGTVAGLLVTPATIKDNIPKRFMDLPPGYLNHGKVHIISSHAIDFFRLQLMITNFRWPAFVGFSYPALEDVRNFVDDWSGRAGRAIFAILRSSYTCTYDAGCADVVGKDLPYLPKTYQNALDVIVRQIETSSSFAICFGNVPTIPSMVWINA